MVVHHQFTIPPAKVKLEKKVSSGDVCVDVHICLCACMRSLICVRASLCLAVGKYVCMIMHVCVCFS